MIKKELDQKTEVVNVEITSEASPQEQSAAALEKFKAALVQPPAETPFDVSTMALAPVEIQSGVLGQYSERRDFFHRWLLTHMREGVHYGFPPGTPGRSQDPKRWTAKPSLYKAGALLLTDLLRLRAIFHADPQMAGLISTEHGAIVMRCELISRDTGIILGEGRGAFETREKNMGANSAIKMCQKRAHVDAVINSIPVVCDLFTQDLEDLAGESQAVIYDDAAKKIDVDLKAKAQEQPPRPVSKTNGPTEKQRNLVVRFSTDSRLSDAWKARIEEQIKAGLTKESASKIIEACLKECEAAKEKKKPEYEQFSDEVFESNGEMFELEPEPGMRG